MNEHFCFYSQSPAFLLRNYLLAANLCYRLPSGKPFLHVGDLKIDGYDESDMYSSGVAFVAS